MVNTPVKHQHLSTHASRFYSVSLFPLTLPQWKSPSSLIRVWCQCLEGLWLCPLQTMSAPGYGEETAAVFFSNWGVASRPSLKGVAIHLLCLSYNTLFWREAAKTLVWPKFLCRTPSLRKSVARLHFHTPCPPCLDWFSVRILEGITAICRLLRNKGGSWLSSFQYFRGITCQINMLLHRSALVLYSALTSPPTQTAHSTLKLTT